MIEMIIMFFGSDENEDLRYIDLVIKEKEIVKINVEISTALFLFIFLIMWSKYMLYIWGVVIY